MFNLYYKILPRWRWELLFRKNEWLLSRQYLPAPQVILQENSGLHVQDMIWTPQESWAAHLFPQLFWKPPQRTLKLIFRFPKELYFIFMPNIKMVLIWMIRTSLKQKPCHDDSNGQRYRTRRIAPSAAHFRKAYMQRCLLILKNTFRSDSILVKICYEIQTWIWKIRSRFRVIFIFIWDLSHLLMSNRFIQRFFSRRAHVAQHFFSRDTYFHECKAKT